MLDTVTVTSAKWNGRPTLLDCSSSWRDRVSWADMSPGQGSTVPDRSRVPWAERLQDAT